MGDREARLDEAIAGYLRGPSPAAREALLAAHPDLADELRTFFADQDRFNLLAAPLRAVATPSKWPARIGPYEVLGEIARGGMGVVLHARHTGLNRDAALKLLLAGRHATEDELARFRREAHTAASLDHPHIVPLYDVGEHDGLPFLAMKLMAGSLAESVMRGDFNPDTNSSRRAASLVALIARAVHHAHQRGLLHRDLKPANVLLDESGQPAVSDFGLARRADGPISTASGTAIGTPAYMSPEQAAGRSREVTVASDVYGLGAVLYELLTGKPPFTGNSAVEVLRKVVDEEPASPRSLAPGMNSSLETIVRKCLDKAPARRYSSALALAEDLERWLAGEPILAKPPGPVEMFVRWVRRWPVVASLSALLVAAVIGGGVLVTQQWLRAEGALKTTEATLKDLREANAKTEAALLEARKAKAEADKHARQARAEAALKDAQTVRAEAALKEARKAQAEADDNFREAHSAVNDFCVKFSYELSRLPNTHALQQHLLKLARSYLERFVKKRAGEPTLRRELADAHVSLGRLTGAIGDNRAAVDSYNKAIAIYRELHKASPRDLKLRRKLAGSISNLATFQEFTPSLVTKGEALALYRRFLEDDPDDIDLKTGLALVLGNRGAAFTGLGRLDEARECLQEAIDRQRVLANLQPTNARAWADLAGTVHNYGVLLGRNGDNFAALCAHQHAAGLRYQLVDKNPRDSGLRCGLAASFYHIGLSLRKLGKAEEGDFALASALALRRKLAEESPRVVRYQSDLAGSLSSLGVAHNVAGRRDQGLKYFHEARAILKKLCDADPANNHLRHNLGEAWFNIGATHGARKERVLEGNAFEEALKLQQPLCDADPNNAEYRHALGRTLNNLGLNYGVRGRDREAVPILQRAVASTTRLLDRAPKSAEVRRLLNAHHGLLALSQWRLKKHADAAETVAGRLALWPGHPIEHFKAAKELARMLPELPKGQLQSRIETKALDCLRRAVAAGYNDLTALQNARELKALRGLSAYEEILRSARSTDRR
jgi:serine/threonine-protein kinase